LPYLVAVNCFDGAPRYAEEDLRDALTIPPGVPLLLCDARDRESAKAVLIGLVSHVINLHQRGAPVG
jgi:signal recognition particle receptor subunit beta